MLVALGGLYMLISILRGALLLTANGLSASSTEKAIKRLRDKLFSHIQHLPMAYFTGMSRGELVQRSVGDVDTVRRFILNQVVEILRLIALFSFSFLMMYMIHPPYALIAIAASPILIIGSFLFFRKESQVWETHEAEADRLNAIVQENLNGIRTVQAFANEAFEIARFDQQNRRKREIGLKHVNLHAWYWTLSDLVVNLQIVLSFIAGGYFAMTQAISIGELLGFYTYVIMAAWPMRQIGRILSKMGMAMVAIGRIYEVLDATPEATNGSRKPQQISGDIEFRNVTFGYDSASELPVLRNVSFRIKAGERIALIGATGSGKSTVINLLVGLYDPDEGEILLDQRPLTDYPRRYLREKIGVVLQSPFLFSTSVRENIAYANPEAAESKVNDAAGIARADQLETVLSDGFDTVVGEKGVTLSGGQKQRVALARTLTAQPDILILDDVTSAVDTRTEHQILEGLETMMNKKTTIIISHRVTTIQSADRVLVLDGGRVVQQGTPESLRGKPGYYRDILEIQTAMEKEILKQ